MKFNKKSLYESEFFLIKRDFDHVHFIYVCIVCWLLLYIVHVGYMLFIQYQGRLVKEPRYCHLILVTWNFCT